MIEFIIGGFIGWAISIFLDIIVLAVVAWLMTEVARKVSIYLKEKHREYSILYKGKAIGELIKNASDPEIKKELKRIKDAKDGLLIPLKGNDQPDYDSICVVRPGDKTYDFVCDCSLIADDGSYREEDYD